MTAQGQPPRSSMSRSVGRPIGAVVLACAVNAGILWLLASLNARPTPDATQPPPVRTILLASTRTTPPQPKKDEPEPPEAEPEPLVVNLDAPVPPTPELQPLSMPLDLPSPTMSPIQVSVPIARPATPNRPPAPTRTQSLASSQPMDADRVDQPPSPLQGNPQPTYPARERRLGIEDDVVVRMLIDERGRVTDARIERGRSRFGEAVLSVVKRWRFTPARHEGKAVQVWGVMTIRFQLTD